MHRELETTPDFAQRLSLKLKELPAGDVFEVASTVFSSIEAKTRKVLRQYECRRKPTLTDRRVSQLSAKTHPSNLEIEELNTLITKISEEKKTRAQKRVHASLVSGGGMRKAMASYSNTMAPPIALTDANGATVSDPASVCSLMSSTLLNLGGDIQQSVPVRTEQKFLNKVKRSIDLPPLSSPSWEAFQFIIRGPKPTKATGLDNLNLYLLSVLPDPLQHYTFKLVSRIWRERLPGAWKEVEIFLLPKGGDPTKPSN